MLAIAYVTALIAANLSAAFFGPAATPINAFLFIGLDLTLRNWFGQTYTAWRMLSLIAIASYVSYLLNPATGQIALASAVAFTTSALVDWGVFRTLSGRWLPRCVGGVTAGAVVDSIVFPTLAFGGFMPEIVALQFLAKVAGGVMFALLIVKVYRGAR